MTLISYIRQLVSRRSSRFGHNQLLAQNPATVAISEPDPLELLLKFGAFLSGINDIFVRFYSRILYFHLLDLLQSSAPFQKVPFVQEEPS